MGERLRRPGPVQLWTRLSYYTDAFHVNNVNNLNNLNNPVNELGAFVSLRIRATRWLSFELSTLTRLALNNLIYGSGPDGKQIGSNGQASVIAEL